MEVSDIAEALGIRYPVAVSSALWRHPEIEDRVDSIRFIMQAGLGMLPWSSGAAVGEFSYKVVLDRGDHAAVVAVQAVVERTPEGRVVATLLEAGESYDLRSPRSGSFYPM